MRETWVRSLGWEDPLEKETATHSSILAWKIPWTKKPGGLQSMGSQEPDTTERLHLMCHRYYCVAPIRCSHTPATSDWTSCYYLVDKSQLTLLRPHVLKPARLLCPWGSPGKNTGMGCHALLQGIFRIEPASPALAGRFVTAKSLGKPTGLEYISNSRWEKNQIISPRNLK